MIREIEMRAEDDMLTRASKALEFAGFVNGSQHSMDVRIAYILEQYAKLDRAAREGEEA